MLLTRARCPLTLMFVLAAVCSAHAADVPLWGRFETAIENSKTYANPFRDVELDAVFTSPSGRTVKFFGYYDGDGLGAQDGHAWKLRFMPDEVGVWSYVASFSDGTSGRRGTFSCVAKDAGPGPLRIDGKSLRFADGTRFFPRSYYFSEAFSGTSPYWESGVHRFFGGQYDYNLCCTTFWQGRLLERHRWNNLPYNGFYPIRGGDYTRLDVAAWKHVDEVLQQLESRGAVWFNFDGFVPNVGADMGAARDDWEAQKIYVRNAVARLAPYWNITWNLAFEWREFLSAEQVRQIADYTRSLDPWTHPITVHDQGGLRSAQEIMSQLHVDFVTLQYDAGKCGSALTASQFVQQFGGRVPVYAHEVCWEAGSKLDADAVRKGGWGVVLAGGILNYAEMFDGPNKGRPENYGDGKALPYLEIMFDFLETLPTAAMRAHNELVNEGGVCLAKPGSCYVCFAPSGGSIELDLSHGQGPWAAQWLNPRSGEVTPCGVTQPGVRLRLQCPSADDWVLCVHKKE